ncbi:Myocyte-specific enhancer factor 2 [Lucilia cuprina]|nr:Myocyte-specific enhancer factor 2 [Lucilia cuprina]
MGRKKIQISRITDERNRQVTFNKRKFGVMKKAYELSVLCDCEIALIIFSSSNKLYQYASTDMDKVLLKYTEYNEPHESLTNKNIIEILSCPFQKENKNGVMSPDSPEPEADYTLTPRTEAKYNKIDEEFQLMMHRTQMAGGATSARNMTNANYTLPVSVPVAGAYGDNMLQSSPQMSHTNISPRPSSSETDSGGMSLIIYPSGSMLEMSNGYPHSHSPLVGSPSPGPSPGIAHQLSHKQQSPGSQNGRASNLRVVIPAPSIAQNMSTTDELAYGDRHNQTSLNTPVMTLQTPIPALQGYPFVPQDFSMSTSDVMSLPSWSTHQGLVHQSGEYFRISHLSVSNSTPPPATSPVNIKVKSEPQSPPRDLSGGHHQQNSNGSSHTNTNAANANGSGANNHSNLGSNNLNNSLSISTHGLGVGVGGGGSVGVIAGTSPGGAGGGGGGGSGGGGASNSSSTSNGSANDQATNLSVLNHTQQHLVMAGSRPSSTGHLTPTPGSVTPSNIPSPDMRLNDMQKAVSQQQQQQQQHQQQQQQQQQQLSDYDGVENYHHSHHHHHQQSQQQQLQQQFHNSNNNDNSNNNTSNSRNNTSNSNNITTRHPSQFSQYEQQLPSTINSKPQQQQQQPSPNNNSNTTLTKQQHVAHTNYINIAANNDSCSSSNDNNHIMPRHNIKQFMQNHLNINNTHQNLQQQQQQNLNTQLKNCSNFTTSNVAAAETAAVVSNVAAAAALTPLNVTSSGGVNPIGMDTMFMYQQQLKQF